MPSLRQQTQPNADRQIYETRRRKTLTIKSEMRKQTQDSRNKKSRKSGCIIYCNSYALERTEFV